mmetsp:Transcript_24658/g.73351  ORF Transcript_24658/g.73351 Transcript_24658/m.73351 type:complete len:427 (-) Transcript_24658:179-1459(-)
MASKAHKTSMSSSQSSPGFKKSGSLSPKGSPGSPGGTMMSTMGATNSMIVSFGQRADEAKTTYGTLVAKARGEKVHMGPLELRKSLPPRDCTSWMYNTCYTPWEREELVKERAKRKKSPPKLWLPKNGADHRAEQKKKREAERAEKEALGNLSPKSLNKDAPPEKSPDLHSRPWDDCHHVMHSRGNHELQSGTREYFGKPIPLPMRPPKVKEEYTMNDRQCGYDDDPLPPGEGRRTIFHDIGPYATGGCKEHQLPSWWRKVKDWSSYSSPELGQKHFTEKEMLLFNTRAGPQTREWLTQHNGGKPLKVPNKKPQTVIAALADASPEQSKAFWRTWAEKRARYPAEEHKPYGWDKNLAIQSFINDQTTKNERFYFSVPAGATGYGLEPPRRREPRRLTNFELAERDKKLAPPTPEGPKRSRKKKDEA